MRRWFVGCFIAAYVSALGFGITCHAVRMGVFIHPAMYFIVWDMYCGWSAYNHRHRVVAEGVSGTYYDLNPAPWGSFRPYDRLDRLQYMLDLDKQAKVAVQVANHTRHEPFSRMFIIEESWAKQFDLPDYIWKAHNAIRRSPHTYTKIAVEMSGNGEIMNIFPNWLETQGRQMVTDNPRLQQEIRGSKSFWMVDEHRDAGNRYFSPSEPADAIRAVGSPTAN